MWKFLLVEINVSRVTNLSWLKTSIFKKIQMSLLWFELTWQSWGIRQNSVLLQRKFCDLVKGKRIWPDMPHRNPQRKLKLNTPANLMATNIYQIIRRIVFLGQELSAHFTNSDNFFFSHPFRIFRIIDHIWRPLGMILKQITFISNSVLAAGVWLGVRRVTVSIDL